MCADETVADEYAALLVQAEWRSFMLRKRRIVDIFKGAEKKLNVRAQSIVVRAICASVTLLIRPLFSELPKLAKNQRL